MEQSFDIRGTSDVQSFLPIDSNGEAAITHISVKRTHICLKYKFEIIDRTNEILCMKKHPLILPIFKSIMTLCRYMVSARNMSVCCGRNYPCSIA